MLFHYPQVMKGKEGVGFSFCRLVLEFSNDHFQHKDAKHFPFLEKGILAYHLRLSEVLQYHLPFVQAPFAICAV